MKKPGHFKYLLGGMIVLSVMSLYCVFRIGTLIYSLESHTTIAERIIIISFFCAEFFIILNAIGYFINILSARFEYKREDLHYSKVTYWPAVTVFIPMRNEPIELIRKTFIACSFLEYPNHELVVIDSSDAPEHQRKIRALAKEYGLTYFLTPYPRHGAKAGAMNEALRVFRTPYVVVFDADYHPSRDFLKIVVPQMEEDEQLAFIQTPQFYGNHVDAPVSRISQIQQSIFYEYICEGKSVHNGMFMCGTNLIIRRTALDSVGGWDEKSITEDYATSFLLALRGWKSRYYNFVCAFGDGPINLEAYFKQQYRWSRGTFGAFFKNFFDLLNFRAPLTFMQRVEYGLSGIYFFVGLIWMILILMPICYIFLRIFVYTSDPLLFSVAYFPYATLSFLFYAITMHARHFKIRDLLKAQSLTFITLPIYIRAMVDAILHKQATFETTKKNRLCL